MELLLGHFINSQHQACSVLTLSPSYCSPCTENRCQEILPAYGLPAQAWTSAKGVRYLQVRVYVSTGRILIPKLPQKHPGELQAIILTAAHGETKDKGGGQYSARSSQDVLPQSQPQAHGGRHMFPGVQLELIIHLVYGEVNQDEEAW